MKILSTLKELQNWRNERNEKTIGFVPTMGALHDGHLSLIKAAKKENDCTIVSIFVNPTQFNNSEDLTNYPRTEVADLQLLKFMRTDAVFIPSEKEIYPSAGFELPTFELSHLMATLEGAHRPGHFDGVVQVVHRLLSLVQPNRLYMGLKDFQQQAIIAEMLKQDNSTVQLVPIKTMREADGLAMSSRNRRLTAQQRTIAPLLQETLQEAKIAWSKNKSISEIEKVAVQKLESAGFTVDYFKIVDRKTLQSALMFDTSVELIACVAAALGDIRLIDNLSF